MAKKPSIKNLKAYRAKVADPVAMEYMERFEFCYRQSAPDLARMQEFQNMYDNVVNPETWPTTTQLPIPFLFTSVHEALPGAMDYLFPRSKWINLIPVQGEPDMGRLENLEWGLQSMLMHRMRLSWNAYSSIHDCFKVGVGYGAIEPVLRSQPQIFQAVATQGSRVVSRQRIIRPGSKKLALQYVAVGPGEIITSKDGTEFNGPRQVSHAFRFTTYSEAEFKRMYQVDAVDKEAAVLKGDVEEIIAEAKSIGFTSQTAIVDDIKYLAGIDAHAHMGANDDRIPARIPVLKVYTEDRHLWIANGTRVIFDESNKYQTMMKPLVKFSANPDGDRWYPMSAIEAAQKQGLGLNLWVNLMYDVLLEAAKPTMVYNKTAMGGRLERGPNGDIGVQGDVRGAATYLDRPVMDQGMFAMGDIMQRWYGNTTGRQMGEMAPGMLRAGANAFEGVLQTTKGRERLANSILEMGSIEDIVRLTLIHMQTMGNEETFSFKDWNDETGQEYIKRVTVTPDDLLGLYDVQLDLSAKHRTSATDQNTRLQVYQALSQNPYYDQYENTRDLVNDDYKFRRGMPSRAKVKQLQEEQRQAQLQARAQGAGQTAPAGTEVEAAAAGIQANA